MLSVYTAKQGRDHARFYPDVSHAGIDVVAPGEVEQAYIHDKYMTELVNGVFLRGTRDDLLRIAKMLKGP